ncbi:MAG: 4Fe-4S binding protein [Endomicrobia bacterium]|nr:4Fe-4S binding protein [Endomicrobiia bacterium]
MKHFVFFATVFIGVNYLFCEEPIFEKFISSFVVVKNEIYPFYLVYEDNQIKEIFVETKNWTQKIYGYGGPINLQIYFTLDGKIKKIKVLEQYETKEYSEKVFSDKFLSQYYGKNSTSDFLLGKDIKGITGATISCTAVNEIIYQCVQNVNKYLFSKKILQQKYRIPSNEIVKTIIFLIIVILSILGYWLNLRIIRLPILLGTIIFLGLNYNGGFSFSHIQSFILLNLPPVSNLFLWILFFVIILTTILFGRLYCGWLCPFGAVIEILFDIKKFLEKKYNTIIGREIELEFVEDNRIIKFFRKYETVYRYIKYVVAVMIFLIPSLIYIEPFQHMFMFYKTNFWNRIYVVIVVVLCIIFVRIWCRYFCPLGAFLAVISSISLSKLKIIAKNCLKCQICVKVCPTNAIVEINNDLKLLNTECILCNKCLQSCGPNSIKPLFVRIYKK